MFITKQGFYGSCPATEYRLPSGQSRGRIIYLHGGGLLYGTREDLPPLHLKYFEDAGLEIIALDYPLAPAAGLEEILSSVIEGINAAGSPSEPGFLLGRSSGAYLCLLASSSGKISFPIAGLLSYYGYGFLTDQWYESPSAYYNSLPGVIPPRIPDIPSRTEGSMDHYYSLYVYARQSGEWKNMLYKGRDKYFYTDFSLRLKPPVSCPLFCAHSTRDTDVPFAEFLSLCDIYHPERFIASGEIHDFDRDTDNPDTHRLLNESLNFINRCLEND